MRSGNALARTRGPQRGLANLDRRGGRRKVTKRATVEARVTFFRLWRNVSPGSTGAARFVTFLPGHHRTAPPAPTAPSSTPIRSLLDAPFRPPERLAGTAPSSTADPVHSSMRRSVPRNAWQEPRPRRRPIRSLLDAPFRPPERLGGTAPSSTADPAHLRRAASIATAAPASPSTAHRPRQRANQPPRDLRLCARTLAPGPGGVDERPGPRGHLA